MKILSRIHSLFFVSVLLLFFSPLAKASTSDSLVNEGWKQWNDNKRDLVEKSFLAAIQSDAANPRAYLGLTLLYTLQEQPEKAWSNFRQAIEKMDNPYRYLYSAWVTSMFRDYHNMEKYGIVDLLQKLTTDPKAPPSMHAMAYETLGGYYERQQKLAKSDEYYDGMNAITDWMLLGAFDNTSACGYDAIFPPETEYKPDAVYAGKLNAPASWFKVTTIRRDRWIDFKRYFAYDDAVFFANTFVYSPTKQKVHIRVGTSGSVKTYLNDDLILATPDEYNNDLDTYIAETELQQGWNRILIKCGHSEIESCNFMVRITDLLGNKIDDLRVSTDRQKYTSNPKAPVTLIENYAERFFTDQIKAYPNQYENYFLLADCYLRNDKAAEAEATLRSGMKLLPECSKFYHSLIEAYTRGKKDKEVSDIYEKLGTLDETLPSSLAYRYAQFSANEQYDEAEQNIHELEAILPESEIVYALYIRLYSQKKQVDKIISYGMDAYKKFPWNWTFTNLAATIALETTKDYASAVNIVKDYTRSDFSSTPLLALANYYLRWGKVDLYEETYNDLLKLDPASPGYYRVMGETFVQAQQYEKAASLFKKMLAICPNSATAWDNLGDCYRMLKKPDDAKYAFQQALLFFPAKYESRSSLRELEGKPSIFSSFPSVDLSKVKKTSISAEEYPEDEAAYIIDDTKRIVYPGGASEYTREIAVKTFNSRGVDDFKEYSIGYNSYTETLTIEKAVVIKADDRSEVKADIDENHIVFKSFEAGDMIYIKWHIKNYYAGKLSKHFWDEIYFNGFIPKKLARYSLLVPKNVPFQYDMQNASTKPVLDTLPDGVLYTWTMENLPSITPEEDMPVLDDIGAILRISSLPNWNYIVQWYYDIARDKTRSSFEIKDQVNELLNGKTNLTEEEKVRIIYNFITEKIRYSYVSFRQSSHVPQRARDVLVHKIGDCKDVATLCIAMLKEINIPAYHVLVNTRNEGKNDHALPSVAFNHCIVGAELKSGMKYLDLTAYNFPMGSVPYMDQDAFALLIKPGVQEPFYLADSLFMPKNISRTTRIKVNADNSVMIDRISDRTGTLAGQYRNRLRDKGKKDIEKEITSIITNDYNTAKLVDYEFKNLDSPESTFYYRFTFSVPNCIIETGGLKILKMMWSDRFETSQALSYDKRNFPINYYPGTDTLREDITITLPAGYRPVDLKPSTSYSTPFGKYSLKYTFSKGVIHGVREFINFKKVISPTEYDDFKNFYGKIFTEDDKSIAFKKGK